MDAVLQVQSIRATDFEVVDLTPRLTGLSVTSGPTAGGTSVTITGRNFSGAAGNCTSCSARRGAGHHPVGHAARRRRPGPRGRHRGRPVQSGTMRTDTDGNSVFFGYGTSPVVAADKFAFGTPPTTADDAFSVLHDQTLTVAAAIGLLINDVSNPAGTA